MRLRPRQPPGCGVRGASAAVVVVVVVLVGVVM